LIDDFGIPRISDYGVSAIQEVLKASTIAPMGQLRYLAPEIVLSESIIRARKSTDVYAFACVGMEVCVPLSSSTLTD
jgi:serine/threonine protein kinase